MVWNMSSRHPDGEVAVRIIIPGRSGGKAEPGGPSCQRLNAMKMSDHGSCLPKGLLRTKRLPDRDVCEQRQTLHAEKDLAVNTFKVIKLLPTTRSHGDHWRVFSVWGAFSPKVTFSSGSAQIFGAAPAGVSELISIFKCINFVLKCAHDTSATQE